MDYAALEAYKNKEMLQKKDNLFKQNDKMQIIGNYSTKKPLRNLLFLDLEEAEAMKNGINEEGRIMNFNLNPLTVHVNQNNGNQPKGASNQRFG